jgi:hypothetical protein
MKFYILSLNDTVLQYFHTLEGKSDFLHLHLCMCLVTVGQALECAFKQSKNSLFSKVQGCWHLPLTAVTSQTNNLQGKATKGGHSMDTKDI